MWIIVEGPDGGGKSTLAAAVAAKMRGAVKLGHLGPPKSPDTALDECLTGGIDEWDPDRIYVPGKWNLVSDRLNMGCPVYGPIFRPDVDVDGYGDFGKAGWRYIELYLASRGAVTFLVQPSLDSAVRRIRDRNDENFFTVKEILESTAEVIDRYDWIAADTLTLGARIYAHTLEEVDVWADRMIKIASAQEEQVLDIARFDDYVGPTTPQMLVVCEPIRQTRLDILDALPDDMWQHVGFCTSAHDQSDLEDLTAMLGFPDIVGLGELPSSSNAFVWNIGGTFIEDVEEVAKSI